MLSEVKAQCRVVERLRRNFQEPNLAFRMTRFGSSRSVSSEIPAFASRGPGLIFAFFNSLIASRVATPSHVRKRSPVEIFARLTIFSSRRNGSR